MRSTFLLVAGVFFMQGYLQAQQLATTDSIDYKVNALLQKMTLEEKIGQMNQYNGFWDATGPVPDQGNAKLKYDNLKKGMAGAVLNVQGTENVRKLQSVAVNESRLGIPLLFGFDVVHGYKTIFPIPLGEAASWDLERMQRSAHVAAIEASAVGINWTFAPMVDITRDARWGRVMEGAGEDPYLGSLIGIARVKGFQGKDFTSVNSIAATAKHFAGYGFVESGRDYNSVDVGTPTLYNIILPPFKAIVDNNVATVMNAFNELNGVPCSANKFLQIGILKNKWDFKGFVVSDWGSYGEMVNHGFSSDLKDAARAAANGGSDMDMESYAYLNYLKELVDSGKVSVTTIDNAVKRILRLKFEMGLFDNPYKYCDAKREKELVYSKDNIALALDIAKRSIVLLKNDDQLLPLNKQQHNIAVIGALANDKNSPLGSWRIGADDSTAVSFLEGFEKYSSNFKYAKGADVAIGKASFINELKINETDSSGFAEAVELAKNSSVVIMVLGEHGFQTGEGRSRSKLDLPGVQEQLLEAVYRVNKNIVLVLMNGRPLAIPWADTHIPAILETWQLGSQCGNAIAQVLFGDYNPGGKLPMTFPRSVGQEPLYYNHLSTGRPGPKTDVFWSHYTDESEKPLYPFGYGLSYTTFQYANLMIDSSDQSKIKVTATIKNTGKVTGEEVVQLYIHDVIASSVRPVKELKGFKKISLKAGESKEVQFTLTDAELGFYTETGEYIVEPGEFDIMVGTNSQEGLYGKFIRK
jgi:beta-glucosidase